MSLTSRRARPRLLLVIGTRPEIIKLAPVIRQARRRLGPSHARVLLTGQHREMARPFLRLFGIRPDYDLRIMKPNQSLASVTERVIAGVGDVLRRNRFDWVVVQGDTTGAFAAALAAFYARVPVAHVEAGLRTHNLEFPFPEELNRQLIGRIATIHFAPTRRNRDDLLSEGIDPKRIHVTGNTVVDTLVDARRTLLPKVRIEKAFPQIDLGKKLVLVTGHRRESFGRGFREICLALRDLVRKRRDAVFVYPVHLNPNVRGPVDKILRGPESDPSRMILMEPVGYIELLTLLSHATLVLTDSGGIQEEAPTFGVPVLVMRDHTERMESIEAGVAQLVGTSRTAIVRAVCRRLEARSIRKSLRNPYGDGRAAQRIVKLLLRAS